MPAAEYKIKYTKNGCLLISDYIRMSRKAKNLVYHIVCSTKHRRKIIDEEVDRTLKQIFAQCPEIKEQLWKENFGQMAILLQQ